MNDKIPQDDKGNPLQFVPITDDQMTKILVGLRSHTKKAVPELMQMAYMPDDLPPARFNFRGMSLATLRKYQFFYAMMGARAFIKYFGTDFVQDVVRPTVRYYADVPADVQSLPRAVGNLIKVDLIPLAKAQLRVMRRAVEERYAHRRSN